MKEKIICASKFVKPGMTIRPECHPTFNHLPRGCSVAEARLIEIGKIERDGKQYEFQTVRILIEVKS